MINSVINQKVNSLGLKASRAFEAANKEIIIQCQKPSSKIDAVALAAALKSINLEFSNLVFEPRFVLIHCKGDISKIGEAAPQLTEIAANENLSKEAQIEISEKIEEIIKEREPEVAIKAPEKKRSLFSRKKKD